MTNYLLNIVDEISNFAKEIDINQINQFADEILKAKKIFVGGAGRSGFAARGFANRLLHLGFKVHFLGEVTTPPIGDGDLLIIGSGSGRTESLVSASNKALTMGAKVITVTISPENEIGSLSEVHIKIPGVTRLSDGSSNLISIQPVGTVFEQLSWIVYDSVVLILLDKTNQNFDDLLKRHANIE